MTIVCLQTELQVETTHLYIYSSTALMALMACGIFAVRDDCCGEG
jgi:hypothetical protein